MMCQLCLSGRAKSRPFRSDRRNISSGISAQWITSKHAGVLLPHVSTAAVIVKNEDICLRERKAENGGVNVFYVRLSLVKFYQMLFYHFHRGKKVNGIAIFFFF